MLPCWWRLRFPFLLCLFSAFTCKACNCRMWIKNSLQARKEARSHARRQDINFHSFRGWFFRLFLRKTTRQHVKQSARRGFWWFRRNHWCITSHIYSESMSRWRFFGFAALLSKNAEANSLGAFGSMARLQELAAIWFKRICELGTPRWQTAAITSKIAAFSPSETSNIGKNALAMRNGIRQLHCVLCFLCPAFCSTVKLAGLYARISFSLVRGTEVAFSQHFFFQRNKIMPYHIRSSANT